MCICTDHGVKHIPRNRRAVVMSQCVKQPERAPCQIWRLIYKYTKNNKVKIGNIQQIFCVQLCIEWEVEGYSIKLIKIAYKIQNYDACVIGRLLVPNFHSAEHFDIHR